VDGAEGLARGACAAGCARTNGEPSLELERTLDQGPGVHSCAANEHLGFTSARQTQTCRPQYTQSRYGAGSPSPCSAAAALPARRRPLARHISQIDHGQHLVCPEPEATSPPNRGEARERLTPFIDRHAFRRAHLRRRTSCLLRSQCNTARCRTRTGRIGRHGSSPYVNRPARVGNAHSRATVRRIAARNAHSRRPAPPRQPSVLCKPLTTRVASIERTRLVRRAGTLITS